MKLNVKYSFFCVFFLMFSSISGQAQRGYTLNFLHQVPQQSKLNPAYYTCYKTYVGFPGVSSVQFQVNNDAFSVNRTFIQRPDTTLLDINRVIGNLSFENNLGVDFGVDILSFGFKIGEKNQIHVGLSVEGFANALITKNTLSFFLRGPGNFLDRRGTEALSGNSVDMSIYGALAFGYSRIVNEKLSVGGRVKFLSGLANVHTESSKIDLTIDNGHDLNITPFTYSFKPDVAIMGSFTNVPEDSNLIYAVKNLASSIRLPSSITDNFGMGFDIGALYDVSDVVTIGASINDIGFINWNTGLKKISSRGQERHFVYSGVGNINDILNNNEFDLMNTFRALKDSLVDYLQINYADTTFTTYRTYLRTSYNLSGFYNITDDDQIGIMWNSKFGSRNRVLTIAYTRMFGPNFSINVNNSIINENAFNFGGGFALNLGPLQLYVIADKVSSFRLINMRAANVHFGLNLALNRIEKDPTKRKFVRDYTPRDRTGYVNDRWRW